jgi:hypothetical protein
VYNNSVRTVLLENKKIAIDEFERVRRKRAAANVGGENSS